MIESIKSAINKLDELSKSKPIKVISHFDTDGITSAAIFSRALQRWNKKFSLQIVKNLEPEIIKSLPETHILIFLDLASNSLEYLKEKNTQVFILDHHEITQDVPENVTMINPIHFQEENISGAGVCYLFAKNISLENKDLASLAVLGMVGDMHDKAINKYYDEFIQDSETTIKKGLLLYPSTRPLDKTLEYSSNPYIPGVSGSWQGAVALLRDANIQKENNKFPSLHELSEEQMGSLVTAVMLKCPPGKDPDDLIGNLYLIKFFNQLADARELSALVNACSRMDQPNLALGFCLGNKACKEQAEKLYIKYKQHLVAALRNIEQMEEDKITGKKYTIINARDKVKDTIIGTVTSMIANSPTYEKGTILVSLAYNEDKIKVSARIAGREGRNVREVLSQVVVPLNGEVGGHPMAAGALISRDQEQKFIEELQKKLEIETIKVN